MVSVDRNTLISQIVSLNPQLKPDELHKLSDAQLQAKLSQCIAGNKQDKNVDSVRINNNNSSETPKMTTEEAQDNAIENIKSNAEQAQKLLEAQDNGDISKAYNFVKEKLNSELAKSNVAKVVHKQFETAEFLREAKQGTLTYKEYIKRKRGFLFNSIPNINNYNDKQRALIKKMIEALSPDKLDTMQTKVLNLPDSSSKEYTQASRKILYDLQDLTMTKPVINNNTLNLVSNKIKGSEAKDHTKSSINNIKVTIAPPFIMEEAEAERLMTFEETYLLEQGVKFNKENIQKFNDSTAQYTFANSLTNKRNEIHSLLTSALEKAKVQGSTGLSSVDLINAELIPSIGASITKLYGKDNLAKGLKDLTNGQYSLNDEIKSLEDLSRKDLSAMNNIAKLILTKIDKNYSKALNGKKLEDYAKTMANDYKNAYGTKDASALASSFAQDQEGIVQTARNTVQIAGMVVMVGGMAFFPPAALGGGLISSFGGIGVEAYNENTKENPDEEKNKELGQEVLVNAALFAIGAGSGKVGSMAKTALTAKNAPKLVAAMADIGVDSSLSLLGDLTLTGQIDLSGEGFSQLMSLVAGHKGKIMKGVQKGKQFLKEKLSAQANTNNKILQMPDGTVVEVKPDGSTVEVKADGEGKANDVKPVKAEADVKSEAFKSEKELKKYLAEKYGLYSERKKTELIELIELYKEYKDAFSALVKEEKFIDGIGNIPKFSIDTIKKLTPLYKEYKAVSSFSERLNSYDANIVELALLYKEYPKEVAVLMKVEKRRPDGEKVPKFGYSDIRELAPLYKKYPKEVSALLKEKKVDFFENETPRFDSEEIHKLAPLYNKYPKEVSTLIKEKVAYPNGNEKPRFDSEEIHKLAPIMNKYPEEVSALLKEKCSRFFDEKEKLRFNSNDIIELAPLYKKYPEEVSTLINAKYVDSNGKELPIFNSEDIIQFAPAIKGYSALLKETKLNFKGEKIPKYNIKEICQLASIKDFNLKAAKEQISKQLETTKAHPEKYINGEYPNEQKMLQAVDQFFNKNDKELLKASAIFDKEALNHLLRMRFDDASEYLDLLNDFDLPDLNLLKQLSNSTNIDGKPFMPTQKVEFIDLLNAYKENNLETTKIEQMAQKGKIDLAQLNIDLFNKIMKNSGLTDDEIASIPKEKLITWDIKYAHLLSKEIAEEKDPAFSDLLRAANLEPDFNKYIHDTNNPYGQANAKTKAMYQENNMNYEAWIKPSKENEVHFVSKDKNTEQLNQIASQIAEDINTLMKTPVKGFLKKQYAAKFFKGDEFVIPQEYLTSKSKLTELVKQLSDTSEQGQLTQVWKRAKGNSTNPDPNRAQSARKTLTILDHLNQRIDDLSKVQDGKATKTLDLTIKMWDRNPQKDIFQGNYSTCCIGMGGGNGSAMPYYIMDTAYNMIELVDNTTGKTIGNALCYMVKGENGKPSFIIDNIEINNSEKPSDEIGKQIRTSMTEYAYKIAKDVTGTDEVPIYIGGQFNDVLIGDLPTSTEKVQFIGDVNREDIYMDLYTDWIDKDEFTKPYQVKQWKLK